MSQLMRMFDKAFYINLDKRTDRRVHIENQLKKIGLEAERFPGVENENGHKGCVLSHRGVIEKAINDDLGNILIIEDDCVFCDDFNTLSELVINDVIQFISTWDLLFFHYNACCRFERTKNITKNIRLVEGTLQTHFYGINCNAFEKVIDAIDRTMSEPIDMIYIDNGTEIDVVASMGNLTKQMSGFSDTANEEVVHQ